MDKEKIIASLKREAGYAKIVGNKILNAADKLAGVNNNKSVKPIQKQKDPFKEIFYD